MKRLFAFMKILHVLIVAVKCAARSCLTALTRKTGSGVKKLNNLYMNWVHVTSFHLTCQQQWGITMRPVIHRKYHRIDFLNLNAQPHYVYTYVYICMTDAISVVTGTNHRIDFLKLNAPSHSMIWCLPVQLVRSPEGAYLHFVAAWGLSEASSATHSFPGKEMRLHFFGLHRWS